MPVSTTPRLSQSRRPTTPRDAVDGLESASERADCVSLVNDIRTCTEASQTSANARARAPSVAYALVNRIRNCQRPIALDQPDCRLFANLLNELAKVIFAAHDYPAAQLVFKAAVSVDPTDARACANVAACCMNITDFEGCEAFCARAEAALLKSCNPSNPASLASEDRAFLAKIMCRRTRALVKQGRPSEATNVVTICKGIEPSYHELPEVLTLIESEISRTGAGSDTGGGDGASLYKCGDSHDQACPELDRVFCGASQHHVETDSFEAGLVCGSDNASGDDVPSLLASDSDMEYSQNTGDSSDFVREVEVGDDEPSLCASQDDDDSVSLSSRSSLSEGSVPALVSSSEDAQTDSSLENAADGLTSEASRSDDGLLGLIHDSIDASDRDVRIECSEEGSDTLERHEGEARRPYEEARLSSFGFRPGFLDGAGLSLGSSLPMAFVSRESGVEPSRQEATDHLPCQGAYPACDNGEFKGTSGALDKSEIVPHLVASASDSESWDRDRSGSVSDSSSEGGGRSSLRGQGPSFNQDSPPRTGASSTHVNSYSQSITHDGYSSDVSTQSVPGVCDRRVLESFTGSDESIWDGNILREFSASVLGRSFPSNRIVDFERFFGPHTPAGGSKKKGGRGNKRAQACTPKCTQCWARRMFRARFPWTRANSVSSGANVDEVVIPDGLSSAMKSLFMCYGGFGSGRELCVNDTSAFVHAVAYVAVLQCEVAWRDARVVPANRDIQSVLIRKLVVEAQKVNRFPGEVQGMLSKVVEGLDGGISFCEGAGQVAWNLDQRAGPVARRVAEEVDAPRISKLAYDCDAENPVYSSKNSALYSSGAAWERVGMVTREERTVFRSLSRDVGEAMYSHFAFQSQYHDRWFNAMNETDDCLQSDFIRIGRRVLFERAKFIEMEVGDIALSPLEKVGSEFSVGPRRVAFARAERVADLLREQRSCSSSRLDASEGIMHTRAIELLSEACDRQPRRPRLLMMCAKRHMCLGKPKEALLCLARARTALAKKVQRPGSSAAAMSAPIQELRAQIFVLSGMVHMDRVRIATTTEKKLECAREAAEQVSSALDCAVKWATRREVLFMEKATVSVLEALENEMEEENRRSSRKGSGCAYVQPTPANLPAATVEIVRPGAAALGPVTDSDESRFHEYIPDIACCFGDCDQKTRSIKSTETWAEVLCARGCVAVCHKKCYRSYLKDVHCPTCLLCSSSPVDLPGLFLNKETADEKRSKRKLSSARQAARIVSRIEQAAGIVHVEDSLVQPVRSGRMETLLGDTSTEMGVAGPSSAGPVPASPASCASDARSEKCLEASSSKGAGMEQPYCSAPSSAATPAHSGTASRLSSEKSTAAVSTGLVPGCEICGKKTFNSLKQYEGHMRSAKHLEKTVVHNRRLSALSNRESAVNPVVQGRSSLQPADVLRPPKPFRSLSRQELADGKRPVRIPRHPNFNLAAAVDCVKAALQAFPGERTTLDQLSGALDMRSYGVSNPAEYFTQHFDGLRHFLSRQQRTFSMTSVGHSPLHNFYPVVSLTQQRSENVFGRSLGSSPQSNKGIGASVASDCSTIGVTSSVPVKDTGNFPSLEASRFGDPARGARVLDDVRTLMRGQGGAVAPTPPGDFKYSTGVPESQRLHSGKMPRDYIDMGQRNMEMCYICEMRVPDKMCLPCEHEDCCSACLEEWFSRKPTKKGLGICPKCQQVVESLVNVGV